MADRGQGAQGAQGRGRGGIGQGAPSAGKQGRGVGGRSAQARSGRGGESQSFRRAAKKTALTMVDFDDQIAKAKEKQKNATTPAAKAAAAKTVAAARSAKAAYTKKAAETRDKAKTQVASSQGRSAAPKATGTGGKTPGPRGQRGGTPAGRSFGKGSGKGQQGQTRGGPGKGRTSSRSNTGSRGPGGRGGRSGGRGGRGGGGRGGRGGGRGCFIAETLIQMLDGTTKPIINIQVGEETKGGIVQAKMEFLPDNIYNYKGVEVSGSHWVIEDNQFIEVENSKHGILTDKIETVYCFKTSENRIWVNGIEFGDYESGSYEDWEPHFEQVKEKLNRELLSK